MNLTRTLMVEIDPKGVITGATTVNRSFNVVGKNAERMERRIKGSTRKAGNHIDTVSTKAKAMQSVFIGLGTMVGFMGLSKFTREIIGVQTNYDRFMNSFKFSFGTLSEARMEFEFMRQESERLKFNLFGAADGYSKFAAAAKGKLSREDLRNVFSAMAEAGTLFDLTEDTMRGVFVALEQMMSKGTVQSQELKIQIGEKIPGAFAIAAQAAGLTEREFTKMLETGKIISADFVPKFAKAMHEAFGKDAQDSVGSMQSSVNELSNAFNALGLALSESGVGDFFKFSMGQISQDIKSMATFIQIMKDVAEDDKPSTLGESIWSFFPGARGNMLNAPLSALARYGAGYTPRSQQQPKTPNGPLGPLPAIGAGDDDIVNLEEVIVTPKQGFWAGIQDGFTDISHSIKDIKDESGKVVQQIDLMGTATRRFELAGLEAATVMEQGFGSFMDSLVDDFDNAGENFTDMIGGMLRDIAKLILRYQVLIPLMQMAGIAVAPSTPVGTIIPGGTPAFIPVGHKGFLAGLTPTTTRNVDPTVFTNAPRFHGGLFPGEMPAILQEGEAVLPRNLVRGLQATSGGANVTFTVQNDITVEGGSQGKENDREMAIEIGRQIDATVRTTVVKMTSPGGELWKVLNRR